VTLIVSNALRLAAVNIVGDALLFLGKLGVAAACGVVAFAISNLEYYHNPDKYPSTYLSSAILPIALAVLTGYIVAQVWRVKGWALAALSCFACVYCCGCSDRRRIAAHWDMFEAADAAHYVMNRMGGSYHRAHLERLWCCCCVFACCRSSSPSMRWP
jgi:hypothetical protein